MGEDILSVIFLALVCIVIAGIIHKAVPCGLMVPTFALIAVCLWIAYDYMLLKRYNAKSKCKESRGASSKRADGDLDGKIAELSNDLGVETPTDGEEEDGDGNKGEDIEVVSVKKHKNEFDIDMYNDKSVQELFKDTGCTGDTKMANRMKYMGMQAKMSQDIRARWNVEKLRPYFEEELAEFERRDWWENDADYLDLLM